MADIIISKLIKNHNDTENEAVRSAYGRLAGIVGIAANVFLFFAKLVIGTLAGSVSVTADAVNNLSDAASSIIGLIGFKLAERPADEEHPYGHGRYEYLSALTVSVLIIVVGIELLKSSVSRILNPEPVETGAVMFAVLALSIVVKLWLSLFNKKIGKRISSDTLIAAAADSRNDIIATGAVLAAAIISHFTNIMLDGFMGVGVAVFIIVSGFLLVKETLDPVLGRAPESDRVEEIRKKIMSYPGVLGTHDLMVHDYGPGRQFASVHVEMAAEADVLECHDTIDNIEQDFLMNDRLHLVIHYDPIVTADTATLDLRTWLAAEVKTVDERITVHDLRIVPGATHTNVIFDCVKPHSLEMSDSELKSAISVLIKREYPDYRAVITVDRSFVMRDSSEG